MTEYTKADYLAACEALWDGKPTEYCYQSENNKWTVAPEFMLAPFPERAKEIQWRPVNPLREYKEAFAAGKRVEWYNKVRGSWVPFDHGRAWLPTFEYRIVEPKTVKLYPFAVKMYGKVHHAGFHPNTQSVRNNYLYHVEVYQINPDGSIEVEV